MPNGFDEAPCIDPDQQGQLEAWQFQVGDRCTNWRVHGFMGDYIFYIVWVDPNHQLYP